MAAKKKPEFDFESVYARYPKKEGKKRGMSALKTTIKTTEAFEAFVAAMDNYLAICRRDRREDRYIKHWGTFVSSWEDYAQPGMASMAMAQSQNAEQLQKILKGDL